MMVFFYIAFLILLFFFSCLNYVSLQFCYWDTFCSLDNFNSFNNVRIYSPLEYDYNLLPSTRRFNYRIQNPEKLEPIFLQIEDILNHAESLFFNDVSRPDVKRFQIDKLCYRYKHLEFVLSSLYGYSKSEVYELVYKLLNGRSWYELSYLCDSYPIVFGDAKTFYQREVIISIFGYVDWSANKMLPL